MQGIIVATLVVAIIGLVLGFVLVTASKKLYVEVDKKIPLVRDCLRGSNCGACGYAGCDAVAEAIVAGEARMDACPGNSTENIAKIAAILGKDSVSQIPQVAFVRCGGNCGVTSPKANFVGIEDCRSAVFGGAPFNSCDYGCLGFGSCVKACPEGAITVVNGVAVVEPTKCVGCGLCAKTCPKGLIVLMERDARVTVRCSNKDKGPAVKKNCAAGCIGCGLCAKQAPDGAITMVNNLPVIDHTKDVNLDAVVDKCPTKALTRL